MPTGWVRSPNKAESATEFGLKEIKFYDMQCQSRSILRGMSHIQKQGSIAQPERAIADLKTQT